MSCSNQSISGDNQPLPVNFPVKSSETNSKLRPDTSSELSLGEAHRRLAMVCLAGLTLLFSSVSYLFQGMSDRTPETMATETMVTPPQFTTEIPEAKNEEWMLLPGVGEKTASTWRKDSTPIESLEELHGVGPIRAERLKPFVANLAAHPKQKEPKSDATNQTAKMRTESSARTGTIKPERPKSKRTKLDSSPIGSKNQPPNSQKSSTEIDEQPHE